MSMVPGSVVAELWDQLGAYPKSLWQESWLGGERDAIDLAAILVEQGEDDDGLHLLFADGNDR